MGNTTRGRYNSKIRRDSYLEILNMKKEGMTLARIGEKFGCTRERIRQILKNEFGLTTYKSRKII